MIFLTIYLFLLYKSIIFEINKRKKTMFIIISIITFILAFNYQMGIDWTNYQKIYDLKISDFELKDIIFNNSFREEKGYLVLNILGNKLGLNYEVFMGILLSFCIVTLLNLGKKYSRNIFLFIGVILGKYLLAASLEPTIRQLLAVSIIALGYKYIERKSLINYLFYVILAMQFHSSAIIGIGIYFLDKINITIKKSIFIILIFPIILKILPEVLEIVSSFIPTIGRFNNYFNNIRYGIGFSRNLLGNISRLGIMFLYLYFIFFSDMKNQKKYIKNTAIFYIIISYFSNQLPILYRVQEYFIFSFAISLSYVGSTTIFDKKIKICKKEIGLVFVCLIYIIIIRGTFQTFYGSEVNREKYGRYKNYFIELVLGKTSKNFREKSLEYEKKIKSIILDQNKQKEINLRNNSSIK